MTIGPLQLIYVKFADEQRTRPISQELKEVRKNGIIRLVDMVYMYKDPNGELQTKQISDLAQAQKNDYGLIIKGLLGMRAAYQTGGDIDKIAEAMSLTPGDFGLTPQQVQKMAADLQPGGSAMLILFEHLWALKLKAALLNAGGELVAQGLISPEALALGGVTLEETLAAVQQMETEAEAEAAGKVAEAEASAAARTAEAESEAAAKTAAALAAAAAITAEADQKLSQAKAEAEAKLAEAQRLRDEAEKESAARLEQARIVAAAAIAASVRTAAGELQQAEQTLEKSKQEADALLAQSQLEADARLAESDQIAQQTIEEGIQTAEQIKNAAVVQALKILVEAQLIKREATQQAIDTLAQAAMLNEPAAQKSLAYLIPPSQSGVSF